MRELKQEFRSSILFITHHLLVVEHISNRVAVMYLGKIVELADTTELFKKPIHPYTRALLSSIPIPNLEIKKKRIILKGDVPSPISPPSGCYFHPRCWLAVKKCKEKELPLVDVGGNHYVACYKASSH